jgi:N-acetylneuraminic acid mutarotase
MCHRSLTHRALLLALALLFGAFPIGLGCDAPGVPEPAAELGVSAALLGDLPWVEVPPMRDGRRFHVMVPLEDGQVLVAGGAKSVNSISSVEVYNPSKNEWSSHPPMRDARAGAAGVRLLSGKVLVTGGCSLESGTCLDIVELFDPVADAWKDVASTLATRGAHTATLLLDGRVLVTGGQAASDASPLCSAEIYDPSVDTWKSAASLKECRVRHTATRLADGRVLVIGGDDTLNASLPSAEIYDPQKDTWTPTAPMTDSRTEHTATLLFDGSVLVAGGLDGPSLLANARSSIERYHPEKNGWTTAKAMSVARYGHTATRLGNGRVLLAGGASVIPQNLQGQPDAELFDPVSSTFSATPPLNLGRVFHVATLLEDGRLFVTGGTDQGTGVLSSAELYMPASGTACATAADCESGFCASGICCLTACNSACDACGTARGAPADGLCGPAVDGASCDDHNACTKASVCQGLVCTGADPVVCSAADACHNAVCDPQSGGCLQIPRRDGADCDDHNPCTYSDACHAGFCTGPRADAGSMSCDAANAPTDQPNGALCGVAGQCASGFCVDGVCCDSACEGTCHVCVLPGFLGTCQAEPVGVDLRHECDPLAQCLSTCGPEGACIGADERTQCLPAECVDDQHSLAPVLCGASGVTCVSDDRVLVDCASNRCEIATGTCREVCRSVHDCAAGFVCDATYRCVAPPTRDGGDDAGCSLARGPRGDGSARWVVGLLAAMAFGRRWARARAAGAARRWPARGRAASGVALSLSAASAVSAVGPLGCSAEAEPLSPLTGPRLEPLGVTGGYPCLAPSECESGSCIDGICCLTTCPDDGCNVCSKARGAAQEGACTGLTGVTCDDHNLCTKASVCQQGVCVGVKPLICGASSPCSDGVCDLKTGECVERAKSEGAACDDGDPCTASDACKKGVCFGIRAAESSSLCGTGFPPVQSGALGVPCSAADQCPSGFCVDGVCCDAACEADCYSCAVPGRVGTCTAESLGLDLRHDCGASIDCLRTCDGNGGCVDSSSASQCDPPRCLGEHQSLSPALCADKGAPCPIDTGRLVSDCSPYACETASGTCRSGCQSVHDCAAGFVCDATKHCVFPPSPSGGDDGGCRAAPGSRASAGESARFGLGLGALVAMALRWRSRREKDGRQSDHRAA